MYYSLRCVPMCCNHESIPFQELRFMNVQCMYRGGLFCVDNESAVL